MAHNCKQRDRKRKTREITHQGEAATTKKLLAPHVRHPFVGHLKIHNQQKEKDKAKGYTNIEIHQTISGPLC